MRFVLTSILCVIGLSAYSQDTLTYQHVEGVVVTANGSAKIAFEDNKYFIVDFFVGDPGTYVLLKNLRAYKVYSLNERFEIIDSLQLVFKPKELFQDCIGNLHILSRDSTYQIETIENDLLIYDRNAIHVYQSLFEDCVASSRRHLIYKSLYNFNQTTEYSVINIVNGERNVLCTLQDDMIVKSIREEQDSLVFNNPGETALVSEVKGYDLEQTAHYDVIHDYVGAKAFFDNVVTLPDNHAIFALNDSIYLFDNLNKLVLIMNDEGGVHRSVPIPFFERQKIIMDASRGSFYLLSQTSNSHTCDLLSSNDFRIIRNTQLIRQVPIKKAIVYNGFIYFLNREFVDANLNKLYRQKV